MAIFATVDDERRRCKDWVGKLAIPNDQLHARILNGPPDKIGRCGWVHRHDDGAAQENSPETRNPFGRIPSPEQDTISRRNAAPAERSAPDPGIAVELRIRQLFPAVPAGKADVCGARRDRKSTRLNSSHTVISYAVCCLKKKSIVNQPNRHTMPRQEGLEGLLHRLWGVQDDVFNERRIGAPLVIRGSTVSVGSL